MPQPKAVCFEIPVTNIERAMQFYKDVFGYKFTLRNIHGNQMAFIQDESSNFEGALAKGEIYQPTKSGVVLYFSCDSIDSILNKVVALGKEILFPKTPISESKFVAEFEDSEGNRIALLEG